jgi:hypothetical protein
MPQARIVSTEGSLFQKVCPVIESICASSLMVYLIGSMMVTNSWCALGAVFPDSLLRGSP